MEEMSTYKCDTTNMNMSERLIYEVRERPLLWDRRHDDYKNKIAMDNEWEQIALILQRDKDLLKQKWRNLRDQFQREAKKIKVPFDNPTKPFIHYYRGKWMYFRHMLFLLNSLKSRYMLSLPSQDIREEDIKTELEVYENDVLVEHIISNLSDNKQKVDINKTLDSNQLVETVVSLADGNLSDDHFEVELIEPKIEIIDEFEEVSRKRKASESESQCSTSKRTVKELGEAVRCLSDDSIQLIQPKMEIIDVLEEQEEISHKRKVSESESECSTSKRPMKEVAEAGSQTEAYEDSDDDLHFLKSLVPYFKNMAPLKKLFVRNEINNLLIKESLCDKAAWSK